jgi:hypothetical protein
MTPYRTPPHKLKKPATAARPNFQALWRLMVGAAEQAGNTRFKAILTNHSDRQEYICRKFGVICAADIARLTKKLQKPIVAPPA